MQQVCREFEALLNDLAGREAATSQAIEQQPLRAHLSECAACREKLSELRWVDRLLSQSFRDESFRDEGFQDDRLRRLLTLPAGSAAARPRLRIAGLRSALAAVAAGLLACFIWSFARERPQRGGVAQKGPEGAMQDRGAAGVRAPQVEPTSEARRWADLQAAIEREASAARLAASAEALAGQTATDEYAFESLRFVAQTFPETLAGIDAARRIESLDHQRKEHRQ